MLIYRLEDDQGNGPIGHDNLALDKALRKYWSRHLTRVEESDEPCVLGAEIGCTTQDTACFGCRSIKELKQYWGKLYQVYLERGLAPVVYEVPDYLIAEGYLQVVFPRYYQTCPVRVDDWPIIRGV